MVIDIQSLKLINAANEVVSHPNDGIGGELEFYFQLTNQVSGIFFPKRFPTRALKLPVVVVNRFALSDKLSDVFAGDGASFFIYEEKSGRAGYNFIVAIQPNNGMHGLGKLINAFNGVNKHK